MNYGLYASAAGAMTNLHRLDLYANNLANADTVGFKPDMTMISHRPTEHHSRGGAPFLPEDPRAMLERLGGNPWVSRTLVDTTQGELKATNQPLDLAISGEGFLVVDGGDGNQHLSRDGRLTMDERGTLIRSADGRAVLDARNRPIRLDRNVPVQIDSDGALRQNGAVMANLQIAKPSQPGALRKIGETMFAIRENTRATLIPSDAAIQQGFLETSATDSINSLKNLISASKAVSTNAKMMQYHDNMMNQAINTFGRVA